VSRTSPLSTTLTTPSPLQKKNSPGFESKALHLLGLAPSPPLVCWYFQIWSPIYAQVNQDCDPPIYTFCIAVMTGVHHYTQLLLFEMVSYKLFAQMGLDPRSS
jgi:hypothetical protein